MMMVSNDKDGRGHNCGHDDNDSYNDYISIALKYTLKESTKLWINAAQCLVSQIMIQFVCTTTYNGTNG